MDTRPPPPHTLELARERLDRALLSRPHDVRLLMLRARADERTGRYAEAANFFERAAFVLRREGELVEEASAMLDCGTALSRAGFDTEAVNAYKRAAAGFASVKHASAHTDAQLALARHELAHRRQDGARRHLELALPALTAAGAHDDVGWALDRLVEITRQADEVGLALHYAREAVRVAARARDRRSFGLRLAAVGQLHLRAAHPAKARRYLARSLPYLRDTGRNARRLDALLALTELDDLRGARDAAVGHLEEALEVVDLGCPIHRQGRVRLLLADKLVVSDPSRARALLAEAVTMFREAGDPKSSALAWLKLAELQHQLGDATEARVSQARARELFAMVGDDDNAARASLPFDLG